MQDLSKSLCAIPMYKTPVSVRVIPDEEFMQLFNLIMDQGLAEFEETGDCESGPDLSYEGHFLDGKYAYRLHPQDGILIGNWEALCRQEDFKHVCELHRATTPF